MASAKVVVLQLPEVEIERFALTEYLRAVLHTIVFHRSLGVVTPVHESSELFQAQWCSIGMAEVSASVEDAVEQLSLDSLHPRSPTSAGGSVTLGFHTKTTVASLIGLGGTTLRKQFEEWRIPFLVDLQPRAPGDGPADTLHRQRRQADLEKAVRSSLLAVATLAVKQADHVPAVDFAVKAPLHFGFTINVPGKSNPSSLHSLRAQAVSGGRAGASADTADKPATTTPAPDEASPAAGGFMGGFSQLGSLMSRMLTTGPPSSRSREAAPTPQLSTNCKRQNPSTPCTPRKEALHFPAVIEAPNPLSTMADEAGHAPDTSGEEVAPPPVPAESSEAASSDASVPEASGMVAQVPPSTILEGRTPDPTNVFRNRTFTDAADLSDVSRQEEFMLKNAQGKDIVTTAWHPVAVPRPRGIVLLVHGYLHRMDHQWHAWASEFNALGLLAVGFNQPGMGSPGVPGLCESFDEYVDNAIMVGRHALAMAGGKWTSAGAPTLPMFMYGQSMGGAVAINAARKTPAMWTGVILSAPMCGIAPERIPNCCALNCLRCLATCMPQAPLVPDGDVLGDCFKCPDQLAHVRANGEARGMPKQPRLQTGIQLYDATLEIQESMHEFRAPAVLLVQGDDDVVTDKALTTDFILGCSSPDRTHIVYQGTWHAMEWDNVDTRQRLVHDLCHWLATRFEAWQALNPTLARGAAEASEDKDGAAAEQVAAEGGDEAVLAPTGGDKDAAPEDAALEGAAAGAAAANLPPAPTDASAKVQQPGPQPLDPELSVTVRSDVNWVIRQAGTGAVPRHNEDFIVIPGTDHMSSELPEVSV